jgi:hypothetical protein
VAAGKAVNAGHKGATAESGPWLLTLDYTTYSAVVGFSTDRELRKKFYNAYRSIASSGATDNTAVINEILAGRAEVAKLTGFPNFAEQAFQGKVGGWCGVGAGGSLLAQRVRGPRRRQPVLDATPVDATNRHITPSRTPHRWPR